MLLRLVGKLLFKATVPLVALAGVLSYGSYLRGGDPAALWKGAVDSSLAQVQNVFAGLKSDAIQAAGAVSSTTQGLRAGLAGSDQGGAKEDLTTVFTWQDARGVKHYSTVKPDHLRVSTVTVDPDVNVLAPVRRPPMVRRSATAEPGEVSMGATSRKGAPSASSNSPELLQHRGSQQNAAELQELTEQLGGSLPGVAGQVLSTSSGGDAGVLDPAQLIRMLQ